MTLRSSLPWMAATNLVMLVFTALPVVGAQGDDGIANNPASVSPQQTLQQTLVSSGDIETTSAIRADTAPNDVQLPAHESAPLGRPNGILGARPHRDSTPQEEGTLAAFDPRTNSGNRFVGALGVVLVLLLGMRMVLKRFGSPLTGGRPSGVLQVLSRFPIGRGQHLVLLQMARRIVLVHQTKTGMTRLSEVSDPDEVAQLLARVEAGSSEKQRGRFQSVLGKLISDGPSFEWERFRDGRGETTRFAGGEIIDLTRRSSSHRPASTTKRRTAP